jgi:alpha-L-rhamnosidase
MSDWPIIWQARWIWCEPPPIVTLPIAPAGIPPRETWNRFCCLRRSFTLADVFKSAPARMTADSRFILYLNGREVARGPARSIPERLAYVEIDLAPYLRFGTNAIASVVRFYGTPVPWWCPARPSFQLGYGSFAFESPTLGIISDSSWKGRPAPYRRNADPPRGLPIAPTEIVDGAELPNGWSQPDFDDSVWKPATELIAGTLSTNRTTIPLEPYTAPEPADIAPLTAIPLALRQLSQRRVAVSDSDDPIAAYPPISAKSQDSSGGAVMTTFDAGRITLATPWIEVHGEAGAFVDVYAGEDLRDDGAVEIGPRFYALRYRLGDRQSQRIEGFEAVGFRYLSVVARGKVRVDVAGAIERRYPRSSEASFACDDERLNAIWQIGARTLDLCSTDAFIDCPFREQRAWLGDSYIHALLTYVTNTDWRLVRRHLRICAQSRRPDGLLAMVAAGDFALSSTTIPDYSLHWLRALARYFESSGDLATVRELMPTALEVLDTFERYRTNDGLIRRMPGWIFIDWAMTERAEVVGALDALYAAALNDFAILADAAGEAARAVEARRRAARTRQAFELLWDETRGVYLDAADESGPRRRVSQQTNAVAIVSECAPRDRWPRILAYVLDEKRLRVTPTIADERTAYFTQRLNPAEYMQFDEETEVVAAQPFFSHFLHQAVAKADRRDLITALCMRWWPQIERGNTTFEEYWNGPSGDASRCHAWSATPTYDLTTHVLGVYPLTPGYARAAIRPRFGTLAHISGRVPTPHGLIELDLSHNRGGTIVIPNGITAEMRFDDAPLRGDSLKSGSHIIARR